MNAKDHKKLTKQIEAHLVGLGALHNPARSYDWTLQTPLGELGITADETHYPGLVSVFCRFNPLYGSPAPTLAMQRFPHEVRENGKWNFHFGKGCTVASAYAVFTADLARTRDARAVALATAQWTPAAPPA